MEYFCGSLNSSETGESMVIPDNKYQNERYADYLIVSIYKRCYTCSNPVMLTIL